MSFNFKRPGFKAPINTGPPSQEFKVPRRSTSTQPPKVEAPFKSGDTQEVVWSSQFSPAEDFGLVVDDNVSRVAPDLKPETQDLEFLDDRFFEPEQQTESLDASIFDEVIQDASQPLSNVTAEPSEVDDSGISQDWSITNLVQNGVMTSTQVDDFSGYLAPMENIESLSDPFQVDTGAKPNTNEEEVPQTESAEVTESSCEMVFARKSVPKVDEPSSRLAEYDGDKTLFESESSEELEKAEAPLSACGGIGTNPDGASSVTCLEDEASAIFARKTLPVENNTQEDMLSSHQDHSDIFAKETPSDQHTPLESDLQNQGPAKAKLTMKPKKARSTVVPKDKKRKADKVNGDALKKKPKKSATLDLAPTNLNFKKKFKKHIKRKDRVETKVKTSSISSKERLAKLQELRRNDATWVECCEPNCKKWRYLVDVKDPSVLPSYWICAMNPDASYNSCSAPQQPFSSEDQLVYSKYTSGSIVWARLMGHPWWPAMVDDDPDTETFFWPPDPSRPDAHLADPDWYHVIFFDGPKAPISRGWIRSKEMVPFVSGQNHKSKQFSCLPKLMNRMLEAISEAESALRLEVVERRKHYSFLNRFQGPWGKAMDLEADQPDTQRYDNEANTGKASVSPGSSQVNTSTSSLASKLRWPTVKKDFFQKKVSVDSSSSCADEE